MATNICIIFLSLLFVGCTSNDGETKEKSMSPLINDTLSIYTAEWRKDSLGCLKLRSKEKAEAIVRLLKKDTIITEQTLYQNLGKPNEKQQDNNNFILIYYFDCACNNGKLVNGSDKCYAKFYIEPNRFKEIDFICE